MQIEGLKWTITRWSYGAKLAFYFSKYWWFQTKPFREFVYVHYYQNYTLALSNTEHFTCKNQDVDNVYNKLWVHRCQLGSWVMGPGRYQSELQRFAWVWDFSGKNTGPKLTENGRPPYDIVSERISLLFLQLLWYLEILCTLSPHCTHDRNLLCVPSILKVVLIATWHGDFQERSACSKEWLPFVYFIKSLP